MSKPKVEIPMTLLEVEWAKDLLGKAVAHSMKNHTEVSAKLVAEAKKIHEFFTSTYEKQNKKKDDHVTVQNKER
jgi:hypothetical protein